MKNEPEILEIFKKSKALLTGHFLLSSGLHSDVYFEKFQILQYPAYVQKLCQKLALKFKKEKVTVVVGPTVGGVLIAYEVAKNLKSRCIFAERENNLRVFKRGFEVKEKERVLLVDDILTTGQSVQEVIGLLESKNAKIVGIGVLLDRSGGKVSFKYPFKALGVVSAQTFAPDSCPLCQQKKPLLKPGSRTII